VNEKIKSRYEAGTSDSKLKMIFNFNFKDILRRPLSQSTGAQSPAITALMPESSSEWHPRA
jgi:hypothetical protein